MSSNKKWYKSKTIQGGIISIIVMASLLFNLGIEETVITTLVQQALALIGTVMVVYGRVVADTKIE